MKAPNILIVEDDSLWSQDLETWVKDALVGAFVQICSDYTTASTMLRSRAWNLVVTDIEGLGTAESEQRLGNLLVQAALSQSIPTIVVSGKSYTSGEVDALFNPAPNAEFRAFDKSKFSIANFRGAVTDLVGRAFVKSRQSQSGPGGSTGNVFVCHGRNLNALGELCTFLRYVGLNPMKFEEISAQHNDKSALDIVRQGMSNAGAVIVLLTPDERVRLDDRLCDKAGSSGLERWQARPNVIFEAGIALAHDETRTVLVTMGNVEPLSNLGGRQFVHLKNTRATRTDLRARLINVGCAVSQHQMDFDKPELAGDFEKFVW